ncbi:hypothetical protein GY45DRAFT_1434409 [Cubamyces sp. BRFM 1775]|nr:hypothetical protein GY45DRAFT_1434409 [Cubamyces sp. BRFM 1775]
MYTRTPSTGSSQWSGVSDAPSTPSHAPKSIQYDQFPHTPRTPNTPLTPLSPGSPDLCAPRHGASHSVAYGLMTPPDSPDKISRGQTDFHPMLDMRAKPVAFDLRQGLFMNTQLAGTPAINHSVNRMVICIGGLYNIEIVSRGGVPTLYDFVIQLGQGLRLPVDGRSTRLSMLGRKYVCVGLTLRSLDRGVAFCDLHLRNGA